MTNNDVSLTDIARIKQIKYFWYTDPHNDNKFYHLTYIYSWNSRYVLLILLNIMWYIRQIRTVARWSTWYQMKFKTFSPSNECFLFWPLSVGHHKKWGKYWQDTVTLHHRYYVKVWCTHTHTHTHTYIYIYIYIYAYTHIHRERERERERDRVTTYLII